MRRVSRRRTTLRVMVMIVVAKAARMLGRTLDWTPVSVGSRKSISVSKAVLW